MKKTLVIVACLVGSLYANAQGYVQFANLGAGVNSPFKDKAGTALTGTGWNVELLAGTTAAAVSALTPVFSGSFNSGYFNAGSFTIPASAITGGNTFIQVRVWGGGGSTSYADAVNNPNAQYGTTTQFQVTPQTSATLPPAVLTGFPLINGNGNLLPGVPEPSTIALGLLGAAALMIRRRK